MFDRGCIACFDICSLFCGKPWESLTQAAFTCSKLTIETLEQGVKYVQS